MNCYATSMDSKAGAFHGGAFWDRVGPDFKYLDTMLSVIPADVLDAWFPPAPDVLGIFERHAELLSKCSPPVDAIGLIEAIARSRSIDTSNISVGAGSSFLIFLALRQWITQTSRVLILDPMYGEYAHLLTQVIGCEVRTLQLSRSNGYRLDLDQLVDQGKHVDWIVIVNPNSPTGSHVPASDLKRAIERLPLGVNVWIDEAYVDYVGIDQSLEQFACERDNVVVCKSLSKCFALSGLRVAHLVAAKERVEEIRSITPPWIVSLPAQMAAIAAFESPTYYAHRYKETQVLRQGLVDALEKESSIEVLEGCANSVLIHLDQPVQSVIASCAFQGVYVRDVASMFQNHDPNAIRVAVRSERENERVATTFSWALAQVRNPQVSLS